MYGTCQMSTLTFSCSQPPPFWQTKIRHLACHSRSHCRPPTWSRSMKLQWTVANALTHHSEVPHCCQGDGPSMLGYISPRVGCRPIMGGSSQKRHFDPQNLKINGKMLSDYHGGLWDDTTFEPFRNLRGQHVIHRCWCCPRGSSPVASWAGWCRSSPIFESATCASKNWHLFTDHQRLGSFLVQDMHFFHLFHFLYYSYVGKTPFCTEEFNYGAPCGNTKMTLKTQYFSTSALVFRCTIWWRFQFCSQTHPEITIWVSCGRSKTSYTGAPTKVPKYDSGITIETIETVVLKFQVLYSYAEFDVDSDFVVKCTLKLWSDPAIDIQRQKTVFWRCWVGIG